MCIGYNKNYGSNLTQIICFVHLSSSKTRGTIQALFVLWDQSQILQKSLCPVHDFVSNSEKEQ